MKIRRTIAAVGVGLLATSAALPASAAHSARIEGGTRYDTAAAISQTTFPAANSAIVATGEKFPDALAASYLANTLDGAPVLLTTKSELSSATSDELARLGVDTVYVLGGPDAIDDAVVDELDEDYDVVQFAGDTRYDTAKQIAEFDPDPDDGSDVGTLGSSGRTAFVATGEKFPDALAAGPLAYHSSFPIILTQSGSLSPEASDALTSLDIEYVIVLGGPVAISQSVQDAIEDRGITTTRLEGGTRRDTAVAVADFARGPLGFTQDQVLFATGQNYPDALAAGPYGGQLEAPIVLAESADQVGSTTIDFLSEQSGRINTVITLGGPVAITEATAEAAASAAE